MQTDIIGVSIGIIGIVVSFYFYRLSLRIKEPYWAIRSNNIIEGYGDKVEGLKVSFKNKVVKNLTISKILFWNSGAETINRQDIETINRLRIEAVENVKILDAKILSSNNPSSQFEVNIAENGSCAYIDFDYLNNKHGAVIQIVHTGISSKDLDIKGDIKGVKLIRNNTDNIKGILLAGKERKSRFPIPLVKKMFSLVSMIPIIVGVAYLVIGIIKVFVPSFLAELGATNPSYSPQTKYLIDLSAFFIGGPIMLALGAIMLIMVKPVAPKGLETFDTY